MIPERESRPEVNGTATRNNIAGQATPSLPSGPPECTDAAPLPPLHRFTPEDAAAVAGGAFVVVVHLYGDRHRRRVFLTLAAAERAARRAEDAGHVAHVLLARVVPLGVIV